MKLSEIARSGKAFFRLQPGMEQITKTGEGTQTRRELLQAYKRPQREAPLKVSFFNG